MSRRWHNERQFDLFGEAGHIARAVRRAKAAASRAAWRNAIQMELSGDWGMRECTSPHHQGNRLLPIEHFVKNGAFRRHSCKCCWALAQREREAREACSEQNDRSLVQMLNKLWRRPTSAV